MTCYLATRISIYLIKTIFINGFFYFRNGYCKISDMDTPYKFEQNNGLCVYGSFGSQYCGKCRHCVRNITDGNKLIEALSQILLIMQREVFVLRDSSFSEGFVPLAKVLEIKKKAVELQHQIYLTRVTNI